ncbi:MAG TPA: hypothetical protein VHO91_18760, partial [Rhodopila sp.]|nr:hypothetical protein [Rhodopila sp.]
MRRIRRLPARLFAVAVLAALLASPHPSRAQLASNRTGNLFTRIADIPLGSATSRTDYESFDPLSQRLYIAKMGAGQVIVFDTGR